MDRLRSFSQQALISILDIGLGQAAVAMSRVSGQKVSLRIASVQLHQQPELSTRSLPPAKCVVRQRFVGSLEAEAFLVFAEDCSLDVIPLLLGQADGAHTGEMEIEAISEVGNIILNACLGRLASLAGCESRGSLPACMDPSCLNYLDGRCWPAHPLLEVCIEINVPARPHQGRILLLLDMPRLVELEGASASPARVEAAHPCP
jgi:chemotaxis protein CheC